MFDGLQDLLTNLLIVLLPLFLTQVFWLDRPARNSSPSPLYLGFMAGVTAVLCMSVPFHLTEEYILDLRQVPLVLSFLYGGYRSGFITLALIIGYRFYLGGSGIYGTVLVTLLTLALTSIIMIWFRQWTAATRITAATGIAIWSACSLAISTEIIYPDVSIGSTYRQFIFQYAAILAVCMWVAVYFIEMIIRNYAMREMIEQSKKMQLVSELAASVSHEVRNPMTVTRGFIQLLRQDGLSQEKKSGFIDLALEELDRAESIISDYLSFAKPQLAHAERLDIAQKLKYVADVISPYAVMNKVDVRLELNESCYVRGERDKFIQCLVNLAKNAIEAMPEGGLLEISVSMRKGKAEIRLQDTGIGMTQEQIARLGTPYYSTKEKGTGLGTMVVYSIIRAMGGRVDVTSKLGSGTCFILTLPVDTVDETIA